MASFMMDASIAESLAVLDMDEDRRAFVQDLITTISADLRDESIHAMALALARVMTPQQAEAIMNGRMPPGDPPSGEALMRASDRMEEIGAEYDRRLRSGYCARYDCMEKAGSATPSVNADGPVD